MRLSLLIVCWLLAGIAPAVAFDDNFGGLPVQDEGRVKPLNSFATVYMERFHGATQLDGMTPAAWLAETMFNPAAAIDRRLFLVKDADARAMLNLPENADHLYSFAQATEAIEANHKLIQSLLQRPEKELSPGQKAALGLYENTALFLEMSLSSTLFLTLSIDLPEDVSKSLGIDAHAATFTDYYRYLPELQKSLEKLIRRKGTNPAAYTDAEKRLAEAVGRLSMTLENSRDNTLLRIIPPSWGGDEWLSPWAVFHAGKGSPQVAETMRQWRDLAAAYQLHDTQGFEQITEKLLAQSRQAPGVRAGALETEVLYYRFDPFSKALGLYVIGFILTLISLWKRPMHAFAVGATGTGALLHGIGIVARIYILARPPVGTLYESLLFVSLVAVLFGLYLERRLGNALGLLMATIAGSVLLFASQGFADGEDSMRVLVAVLNTNFWLATHVLCITTGYGFGIAAAIAAHIHLVMRCANRDHDKTRQVLRGAYATALIALLFTSVGTMLGGIWADQSWGRFWGWDPKENGALLICLWLIWVLHGRISLRFSERGFAVVLALLNVVIALSWLGVNLLSTGLHSYGFTDKAALALASFCAAEFAFAAATFAIIARREHAAL